MLSTNTTGPQPSFSGPRKVKILSCLCSFGFSPCYLPHKPRKMAATSVQPSMATSSASTSTFLLYGLIYHGPLLTPNMSLHVLKGRNLDLFVDRSSPESVTHDITGNAELDPTKNTNPKYVESILRVIKVVRKRGPCSLR